MVALALMLILLRSWDMDIFRAAMRDFAAGQSPYTGYFHNPPWLLLLLLPTLIISREMTVILYGVMALLVIIRLIDPLPTFEASVILLSPWVVLSAGYINFDWLTLGGAFLPPAIGVWFLAFKPQIGGFLVAFILWQAWRGRRELSRIERLDYLVFVACFALYLLVRRGALSSMTSQSPLFPYAVIPGAVLALIGWKQQSRAKLLAAAPLVSPYAGLGTAIGCLPELARHRWLLWISVVLAWVFAIQGRWI